MNKFKKHNYLSLELELAFSPLLSINAYYASQPSSLVHLRSLKDISLCAHVQYVPHFLISFSFEILLKMTLFEHQANHVNTCN